MPTNVWNSEKIMSKLSPFPFEYDNDFKASSNKTLIDSIKMNKSILGHLFVYWRNNFKDGSSAM